MNETVRALMHLLGIVGELVLFCMAVYYGVHGRYPEAAYFMAFSVSIKLTNARYEDSGDEDASPSTPTERAS